MKWLFLLLITSHAHAFQILSTVTNSCHESMTLGLVGAGSQEFRQPAPSVLLSRFVATVRQIGVPQDRATQALIKEMDARFNWAGLDDATRYVLASLVAGARMPDTHGFSVIDIDHVRDNHLTDSAQATHMLRNRTDDLSDGNQQAITRTRAQLSSFVTTVLSQYANSQFLTQQTWAFPFYGEVSVQLFGPAFFLGQVSHSIEDSYAHTIRDSNFNILAISNYIEAMEDDIDEDRDGPPHSDRLDQCNMADAFDKMRIDEAQRQLLRVYNQFDSTIAANSQDPAAVESILDDVFIYQAGCVNSNNYCGSEWIAKAREEVSKPYKLGFNCGLVKDFRGPRGPGGFGLLLLPIAVALLLKRRLRT